MPSLREMAARDARTIVRNLGENAEEHIIDGRSLRIVVDNDALRERNDAAVIGGIDRGTVLYFALEEDFPEGIAAGQVQVYDGRPMRVTSAINDGGVLEVTLSQNRMGG